jgi:hypothetical protein
MDATEAKAKVMAEQALAVIALAVTVSQSEREVLLKALTQDILADAARNVGSEA